METTGVQGVPVVCGLIAFIRCQNSYLTVGQICLKSVI